MKRYVELIKRYGLINFIKRSIGTILYRLFFPIYQYYLKNYTKMDDKKIVFASEPSFSDNSKVMYEYLKNLKELKDYHFVWLIDMDDLMPDYQDERTSFIYSRVKNHTGMPFKTMKEVVTSKYVFFTHGSPIGKTGIKKDGQIVVNLWHGCGYKDIQKTEGSWISQNPCDILLVPGKVFIDTKTKFWGCERDKILTMGYPRYDLLFKDSDNAREYSQSLKKNHQKLIVWMPTFRKTLSKDYPESQVNRQFELPLLSSLDQLKQLDLYCEEKELVLCIKRHPYQLRYLSEKHSFSNIIFISNEDLIKNKVDLYAFLPYTDALISDYSSVSIDYLLLDKPIAFSLDDFEDYKNSRGFVFKEPRDYMPGHHLYTYSDMLDFIEDVSNQKDIYKEKRLSMMSQVHCPCEDYCGRIWQHVKKMK